MSKKLLKEENERLQEQIQDQLEKIKVAYLVLKERVLQRFVDKLGLEHCLEHLQIVTYPQDRIDGIERLMYRGTEVGQFRVQHKGLTFICVFAPVKKEE